MGNGCVCALELHISFHSLSTNNLPLFPLHTYAANQNFQSFLDAETLRKIELSAGLLLKCQSSYSEIYFIANIFISFPLQFILVNHLRPKPIDRISIFRSRSLFEVENSETGDDSKRRARRMQFRLLHDRRPIHQFRADFAANRCGDRKQSVRVLYAQRFGRHEPIAIVTDPRQLHQREQFRFADR